MNTRSLITVLIGCLAVFLVTVTLAVGQEKAQKAAHAPLKKVKVNGRVLNYIEQGTGEPVVFVHGSLGDYRTWRAQMDTFARHFRVISYSRRYHYPNNWVGTGSDDSVGRHAEDLAAFIKALKLPPVHLIGHS